MQFTKFLQLLSIAVVFSPACHKDGLSTTDGSIKMTTQACGPSSVCIVDEDGVIYHPAESGEY